MSVPGLLLLVSGWVALGQASWALFPELHFWFSRLIIVSLAGVVKDGQGWNMLSFFESVPLGRLTWAQSAWKYCCFIRMVAGYCWCSRMLLFTSFLIPVSPELVCCVLPGCPLWRRASPTALSLVTGFSICPSPRNNSLEWHFCNRCVLSYVCRTAGRQAALCKPLPCGNLTCSTERGLRSGQH